MKVKETTRKKRRKQTAEVFTPTPLVNEMLKKIPREVLMDKTKTFLDNSCGNGQFLVQILGIKLGMKHTPEEALSTIFGTDIMPDNIEECRFRMLNILQDFKIKITPKHCYYIANNILCRDGLTYNYDFKNDRETLKTDIKKLMNYLK